MFCHPNLELLLKQSDSWIANIPKDIVNLLVPFTLSYHLDVDSIRIEKYTYYEQNGFINKHGTNTIDYIKIGWLGKNIKKLNIIYKNDVVCEAICYDLNENIISESMYCNGNLFAKYEVNANNRAIFIAADLHGHVLPYTFLD